jgi:hypothetical protein
MYSPTPDEFLKLAAQGNGIPVTRHSIKGKEFRSAGKFYKKKR